MYYNHCAKLVILKNIGKLNIENHKYLHLSTYLSTLRNKKYYVVINGKTPGVYFSW